MGTNGNAPEPQREPAEIERSGRSLELELITAAASTALAPYLREATDAAAAWVAERWPDYVEKTLLPALGEAVGHGEDTSTPGDGANSGQSNHANTNLRPVRAGLIAGAAATVVGVAGIAYARR